MARAEDAQSSSRSTGVKARAARWRRIAFRALLVLVTFVVLLASTLVLGLRSKAVRQSLLGWAAETLEESAGIRATARDFSLGLWRGEIEIEGLALSAPALPGAGRPGAARPFLASPRVSAVVSWGSFLGDRIAVRSLHIEEPLLDFGAPLPETAT